MLKIVCSFVYFIILIDQPSQSLQFSHLFFVCFLHQYFYLRFSLRGSELVLCFSKDRQSLNKYSSKLPNGQVFDNAFGICTACHIHNNVCFDNSFNLFGFGISIVKRGRLIEDVYPDVNIILHLLSQMFPELFSPFLSHQSSYLPEYTLNNLLRKLRF